MTAWIEWLAPIVGKVVICAGAILGAAALVGLALLLTLCIFIKSATLTRPKTPRGAMSEPEALLRAELFRAGADWRDDALSQLYALPHGDERERLTWAFLERVAWHRMRGVKP